MPAGVEADVRPAGDVSDLDGYDAVVLGGALPADATGFIAGRMTRSGRAGDWRDLDRVRAWAAGTAEQMRGPAR